MTSQRFRVIHSVDWRLALLVAVVLLALQACTIHVERATFHVREAEVVAPGPVNVQNAAVLAPAKEVKVQGDRVAVIDGH